MHLSFSVRNLARETKYLILLPLALFGAAMIAGVGLLGMLGVLVQLNLENDDAPSIDIVVPTAGKEIAQAQSMAQERFEASMENGEMARSRAPQEMEMPLKESFSQPMLPEVTPTTPNDGTRSSDDLLSQEGYLKEPQMPGTPPLDIDGTVSLLGDGSSPLMDAQNWLKEGKAPDELIDVPMKEADELPVSDDGVTVDPDLMDDISEDLSQAEEGLGEVIDEYAPEGTEAGLNEADLSGMVWDIQNSTWVDSDKDGNYELIYKERATSGTRNGTIPSSVLSYIVGYMYRYVDSDDNGIPELEETVMVRYANLTISGKVAAEGVSFTHLLRNDTDGDGYIDLHQATHLSYGFHLTLLGGVKTYAYGGDLRSMDKDGDGTFESKEGSAVLFFKHELGNPLVTVREAIVLVHAKVSPQSAEAAKLAFNRVNTTAGVTVLEEGYAIYAKETPGYQQFSVMAGRSRPQLGTVQYALLNASKTITGANESVHITAFAVENRTLLGGALRSDVIGMDLRFDGNGTAVHMEGSVAAARNVSSAKRTDLTFLFITGKSDEVGGKEVFEEITAIYGNNVTTTGLVSIFVVAYSTMTDADGDGNPEYKKAFVGASQKEDSDMDGNPEKEGYILVASELRDLNSDGKSETNNTLLIMGWKTDGNSDGILDQEKGIIGNTTSYDNNTNGNCELTKKTLVGFEKTYDANGTIATERYAVNWEERTDVKDDGTEVNVRSGTWVSDA